ncbi:hypothetical protein RvY_15210-4 [Ramazzottius varieornatus]|uniref:Uncharacterized protein n=1 Tax=Ramazzottius varieornatus TaxID=947166 RepID=A0A1D1VVF3_RAMVA|nr:hypothetical protein RvY_15210-4 [Ramazzottius varieornatus]
MSSRSPLEFQIPVFHRMASRVWNLSFGLPDHVGKKITDLPWPHLAVSQNLYPSLNAYHALRVILVSGCRTVQTETSQDDLETSENHRPETCLPTKRPLSCPCNTLKIEVFKWCFFLPAVMVDMTSF